MCSLEQSCQLLVGWCRNLPRSFLVATFRLSRNFFGVGKKYVCGAICDLCFGLDEVFVPLSFNKSEETHGDVYFLEICSRCICRGRSATIFSLLPYELYRGPHSRIIS